MKKFKYVYHIVYMSENNIYGSCVLYREYPLNSEHEIELARQFIKEEYCKGKNVIILNFILLNKRGK